MLVRHRALHPRAASGMGGGALQEARRACGTRRRHAAGLVLTAIALAAAGTAIWTTGMAVHSAETTAMHAGPAGTVRARCDDQYDGEFHYGSSETVLSGARGAGDGPTGGGVEDDKCPLGSTCRWARCGANAENTMNTLDGERGGADTTEDISDDLNETGDTTTHGASYIPRRNSAFGAAENQLGGQKATEERDGYGIIGTKPEKLATYLKPYLSLCALSAITALAVTSVAAGLLVWLCRERRKPLNSPRAEPCEWSAWTGLCVCVWIITTTRVH